MSTSYKKECKIKYPLFAAAVGIIHVMLLLLNYYTTLADIARQFQTHNYSVIFPAISQALSFICVALIFTLESAVAAFAVCAVFGAVCTALMPSAFYSAVPVLLCLFLVKHIIGKGRINKRKGLLLAAALGIDLCAAVFGVLTRDVSYLSLNDIEGEKKAAVVICFFAAVIIIAALYIFAEKKAAQLLNKSVSRLYLLIFAVTLGAYAVSFVAFGEIGQFEFVSIAGYVYALTYLMIKYFRLTEKKCSEVQN